MVDKVTNDPDFANDPFFRGAVLCWPKEVPGCIPSVRDQGPAYICYGFPVVNTIFAEYYLRKRCRPVLVGSVQELLDCLPDYLPSLQAEAWLRGIPTGVRGQPNTYSNAFDYVKFQGLYTDRQYPFIGEVQSFKKPESNPDLKIFIKDARKIPSADQDSIIQRLNKQPVTGTIKFAKSFANWGADDGVYPGFNSSDIENLERYRGGIHSIPNQLHGLTIVGYGPGEDVDEEEYYLCQNSFGPYWCHHGYIKVRRELISNVWYPEGTFVRRVP